MKFIRLNLDGSIDDMYAFVNVEQITYFENNLLHPYDEESTCTIHFSDGTQIKVIEEYGTILSLINDEKKSRKRL